MMFTPADRFRLRRLAIVFTLFLGIVGFYLCPVLADSTTTPTTKAADPAYKNQRSIVFTTAAPEILPLYAEWRALYTEAFRRMGYRFQLEARPERRTPIDANSGKADGTVGRIFSLATDGPYPNLIRVDEIVVSYKSVAWTLDPSIRVDGWSSLNNFTVTYAQGNKYLEQNLAKYVAEENIIIVTGLEQALRLIVAGRADIFVEMDVIAPFIRMLPEFKNKDFLTAGTVTLLNVYPYLHRKHKALAPKLAETLKEMKAEGIYYQLMKSSPARE